MQSARFAIDRRDGAAVLHLSGDLRVDQVPDLYDPLTRALRDERLVIADLSGVVYLDSAGIAFLVGLSKRLAAAHGGRIVLCGVREAVLGVFRTMKLDRLFPIQATLADALVAEGLVDREATRG
jgi:anti-sigma B factor antagonist